MRVVIESQVAESEAQVERNIEYAKACIEDSLERGEAPFSPQLLYTRYSNLRERNYEGHSYEQSLIRRHRGTFCGYEWGKRADAVAVYVDLGISDAMAKAINEYQEYGMDVEYRSLRGDPDLKPVLLAISGKMASGKTTLANTIVRNFPEKRVAFISNAWPLKKVASELCGMSLEEEKKDRPLLIDLGNVVREREVDRLVNLAVKKAQDLSHYNDIVIVDDLRFKNEAPVLKNAGFKLVRCFVEEEMRKDRIKAKYPDTWPTHFEKLDSTSETQLDDYTGWDFELATDQPVEKELLKRLLL